MIGTYLIIAAILLAAELCYFKIADHFNIIDKPNERSSHSTIVLRGGGIIFTIAMIVWVGLQGVHGDWRVVVDYLPFLIGLVIIAGVSFIDDIHSLPDSVRLVAQFISMALMFWNLFGVQDSWFMVQDWYWKVIIVLAALIVFVGATNIINFMDGINGITAGYSFAVLLPLALVNGSGFLDEPSDIVERMVQGSSRINEFENSFIDQSYLIVAIIGVLVFSWFNFRPKGEGEVFCRGRGFCGHSLYYAVRPGEVDHSYWRCGLAGILDGVWSGWSVDHLPPYHAS